MPGPGGGGVWFPGNGVVPRSGGRGLAGPDREL